MGTGKWPCMVNSEEFWKKHTHLISHEDGIHCFHIPSCVTSVSQ